MDIIWLLKLIFIYSQPPLLSSMIYEIYKRTGDINLVKKALPALLKEHKFWNSGARNIPMCCVSDDYFRLLTVLLCLPSKPICFIGIHKVTIRDSNGCTHNMSRYYAMWNKPRPESSTIVCSFPEILKTSCSNKTYDSLIYDDNIFCRTSKLLQRSLMKLPRKSFTVK